jgi:prepilin-type N-terminal cleavage/methylation domain-containing protein
MNQQLPFLRCEFNNFTKMLLRYCKSQLALNNGPQAIYHIHRNGFTLLELIVVITLLGIMLVFTVPRFHDTLFLALDYRQGSGLKRGGHSKSKKLYPAYRSGYSAVLGNR